MNCKKKSFPLGNLPFYLTFLLFFLLYFGLAFYDISSQDMKTDELITSAVIKKDWGDLILNRLVMGHPPLYFLLCKAWMISVEHSPVYLYAFTILVGSFGIPLMYLLAKEMKMGNWSLIAALYWSVHPAVLYYARLIRPQIFVSVLSIAYLLILLRLIWSHSTKEGFALLILGTIGALISPLFLFFWVSILITSLIVPTIRKLPGKGYWIVLVSILGIQVAITLLVNEYSGGKGDRVGSISSIGYYKVIEVFIEAFSGVNTDIHDPSYHWAIPLLSFAFLFWLLCFNNRLSNSQKVLWFLLLGNVVISLFLFWGVSYTLKPLWTPRYFVSLLPAMILVVVQALIYIPSKKIAIGSVGLILLATLSTSLHMIEERYNGLRDMVRILELQYEPERDGVLVLSTKTKEALSLYAETDFNVMLIRSTNSKEKLFRKLNSYLAGKSRLWVIWYEIKRESLFNMKEWEPLEEKTFLKMEKGRVHLQGYELAQVN